VKSARRSSAVRRSSHSTPSMSGTERPGTGENVSPTQPPRAVSAVSPKQCWSTNSGASSVSASGARYVIRPPAVSTKPWVTRRSSGAGTNGRPRTSAGVSASASTRPVTGSVRRVYVRTA
jgi:hypothetical protein